MTQGALKSPQRKLCPSTELTRTLSLHKQRLQEHVPAGRGRGDGGGAPRGSAGRTQGADRLLRQPRRVRAHRRPPGQIRHPLPDQVRVRERGCVWQGQGWGWAEGGDGD